MNIENLPEVLEPMDIAAFLSISKSAAYKLVKEDHFYTVRVGKLYKTSKQSFVAWFTRGQKMLNELYQKIVRYFCSFATFPLTDDELMAELGGN